MITVSRDQLRTNIRWEINRVDGADADPLKPMDADSARARFATVLSHAEPAQCELADDCAHAMSKAATVSDVLDAARALEDATR